MKIKFFDWGSFTLYIDCMEAVLRYDKLCEALGLPKSLYGVASSRKLNDAQKKDFEAWLGDDANQRKLDGITNWLCFYLQWRHSDGRMFVPMKFNKEQNVVLPGTGFEHRLKRDEILYWATLYSDKKGDDDYKYTEIDFQARIETKYNNGETSWFIALEYEFINRKTLERYTFAIGYVPLFDKYWTESKEGELGVTDTMKELGYHNSTLTDINSDWYETEDGVAFALSDTDN